MDTSPFSSQFCSSQADDGDHEIQCLFNSSSLRQLLAYCSILVLYCCRYRRIKIPDSHLLLTVIQLLDYMGTHELQYFMKNATVTNLTTEVELLNILVY